MKQSEERSKIAGIFRSAFRENRAASEPPKEGYHPADDLEFLERLENDALSETERADALRHITSCPFCRHEIADYIRTGVLFAEEDPSPARSQKTISTVSSAGGRGRFLSRTGAGIVAAAALVLVAVGAGILFNTGREPRPNWGTLGSETDFAAELKKAEQGFADAQNSLGVCYRYGTDGIDPDPVKAAEWFCKAAEQGYACAQYELGICRAEGIGVEKDPAEAFELFRKAAEQNHTGAQYELGKCYAEGIGVEQNPAEAFESFRKAAERGYDAAQYRLGMCYAEGIGVAKDGGEAVRWLQESIDQGFANAETFRKAAEEGHAVDPDILSKLYLGE